MGRTVSVGQVALEAANDSQGHGIGSVADSSLPVPDSFQKGMVSPFRA
jgi:hypothetical protein